MAQFSLRQLGVFVFACCVYLAAIRGVFRLKVLNPGSQAATEISELSTQLWLADATQIGAWLVLFAFYCYWRLWGAMAIHSSVYAVGLLYLAIGFFDTNPLFPFVICTAYGTLISFPIALVAISLRGLQKR